MASSTASSLGRTVSIAAASASALVSVLAALVLGVSPGGNGDVAQFFGRFHPLVVHLPIGAVVLVVVLEAAALLYREPTRFDGTLELALPVSTASAAASFVLGLLLAGGGGYPPSTVAWHRALTLAAIVLLAAVSVVFSLTSPERRQSGRTPYRTLLTGTLFLLSVGAHFGGTLSRGEGYLTRYAPDTVRRWLGETIEEAAPAEPPRVGEEPLIYAEVVVPLMTRTCVSCHGPKEAKGKLRLDSLEAMQKGGDDGPAVLPGQGSKSPLYARIALPLTDDDHMPPADHPQPTDAERELLRFWIDRGATETLRVADALPPAETRALLEGAFAARAQPKAPEPTPSVAPEASVAPSAEPEAPPVASPPPRAPAANGAVFADVVMPILRARCESCHGAAKQKGKLRVDSLAALLAGGKGGPAVIAGSSGTSPLIQRIHLPLSDDKHMPPPKSPQPSESEVRALAWWIDQGAKADTPVSAMPAALRGAPKPAPAPPPSSEPPPAPLASAAPPAVSEGPTLPLPASVRWEADVVLPLLASRCGSCHGGAKPEGGLSFDDRAATFRGGDSGPAIVPGEPDKSSLLQRVKLPESDEEHMPPSSFTQLTPGEVALLAAWIRAGAVEGPLETAGLPNEQKAALAALLPPPAEPVAVVAPPAVSPPRGASGPPPVPPTGGCAACAIGAVTGGLLPLSSAAALLVLLLGRRVSSRPRARR
jgi:uncharacterized membrane protein